MIWFDLNSIRFIHDLNLYIPCWLGQSEPIEEDMAMSKRNKCEMTKYEYMEWNLTVFYMYNRNVNRICMIIFLGKSRKSIMLHFLDLLKLKIFLRVETLEKMSPFKLKLK